MVPLDIATAASQNVLITLKAFSPQEKTNIIKKVTENFSIFFITEQP
jgi:hypothetical protein